MQASNHLLRKWYVSFVHVVKLLAVSNRSACFPVRRAKNNIIASALSIGLSTGVSDKSIVFSAVLACEIALFLRSSCFVNRESQCFLFICAHLKLPCIFKLQIFLVEFSLKQSDHDITTSEERSMC